MNNQYGWGDFFSELAGLAIAGAIVGGVAYAWKKNIDSEINRLIALSEVEAAQTLADQIPRMDEQTWSVFIDSLSSKAEENDYAQGLLIFSLYVRQAMEEIQQLLSHSIQDAIDIICSILPHKNELEQIAFIGTLNTYAGENIKARALVNQLSPAIEGA